MVRGYWKVGLDPETAEIGRFRNLTRRFTNPLLRAVDDLTSINPILLALTSS
jgi:hypothetical protein